MTRMLWILVVINVTAFHFGWYARGRMFALTIRDTTKVWERLSGGRAWTIPILASATGLSRFRVRLALTGLLNTGRAIQTWVPDPAFGGQMLWRATIEPVPGPSRPD